MQLAKHTPSEIIRLALSCAMLEHCSNKPDESASQRLNEITSFLEEAVQIVPIESIFHAIGYDELETAVECAKALLHTNPIIPHSHEVAIGLSRATVRMKAGIDGREYDNIAGKCLRQLPVKATSYNLTAISSDELKFSVSAPIFVKFLWSPGQHTIGTSELILELTPNPNKKTYPEIASDLLKLVPPPKSLATEAVCGLSIEHVYPINSNRRFSVRDSTLKSPIDVLRDARKEIAVLLQSSLKDLDLSAHGSQTSNEQMLSMVKSITDHSFKICSSLIGGFMEQQIHIPFLQSEEDTASKLSETCSPVAMGLWTLFSLTFDQLYNKVAGMHGNPLLLEIADYISTISPDEHLEKTSKRSLKYAGKLQFLLQGMRSKTITCSNKYISYSLERQLCSNLKFDKTISVKKLIKDWDNIFKGDALSLVAQSHRSLVARWLKWALLVHDLRESLARYTCVGITGLINSGKSYLVSKLFDIQVR